MSVAVAVSPGRGIRPVNAENLRRVDWKLSLIVLALAVYGVVLLVSADQSVSFQTPLYLKQAIYFGGGLVIALGIACLDHRFLVSIAPVLYAVAVVLLVAVELWGYEAKGGQRWIDLGLFNLQPSEQAKLAVVFCLAWYLNLVGPRIRRLFWFLLSFVIVGVPALLIFKQPNLGTAAAMAPILFAMLWVAGCRRGHLIAIGVAGLLALPVAWSQMKEYQRARVMTFLDPSADPQGSGYHTIQSIITVGSGGMTGKGFQQGTQTYLRYLPEHHTDFIFSLLAEELGFIGSAGALVLFGLLFFRGLVIARNSQDMAGALLAVGIVSILAFHVVVNIAITVGLMPVTGIPLPFLSYGGSFYLLVMMCVGVLLSVQARPGLFRD